MDIKKTPWHCRCCGMPGVFIAQKMFYYISLIIENALFSSGSFVVVQYALSELVFSPLEQEQLLF